MLDTSRMSVSFSEYVNRELVYYWWEAAGGLCSCWSDWGSWHEAIRFKWLVFTTHIMAVTSYYIYLDWGFSQDWLILMSRDNLGLIDSELRYRRKHLLQNGTRNSRSQSVHGSHQISLQLKFVIKTILLMINWGLSDSFFLKIKTHLLG